MNRNHIELHAMNNQFNPGQRIYDSHGRAAQFLMRLADDKFIVLPLWNYGDKETVGLAEQWNEAFIEAPIAIYDESMTAKKKEIEAIEKSLAALKDEYAALVRKMASTEREQGVLVDTAKALIAKFAPPAK